MRHSYRALTALTLIAALAIGFLLGPDRVDRPARTRDTIAAPVAENRTPALEAPVSAVLPRSIRESFPGAQPGVFPASTREPALNPAPGAAWSALPEPVRIVWADSYAEGWTIESRGVKVRQSLLDAQAVRTMAREGARTYEGVLPGVDAFVISDDYHAEEFLRVAPYSADVFVYELSLEGAGSFSQTGGGLVACDDQGRAELRLGDIVYWRAGHPEARKPAETRLEFSGDRLAHLWIEIPAADAGAELLIDPAWSTTRAMATVRRDHTATLLNNGKVLVVGGRSGATSATALGTCEVYDPATGIWSTTGTLTTARYQHTATLLPNGKVLASGGWALNGAASISGCELYDPVTGAWSSTGSMSSARYLHSVTLLLDGKALAVGGSTGAATLSAAETYDPASGTWTSASSLGTARHSHAAALLPSGKVLIAGGNSNGTVLSSCELFDPVARTWSATGTMTAARYEPSATLLQTGKVLVAGGADAANAPRSTCELYDPTAGTWAATGALPDARWLHSTSLLPNGKVLLATGTTTGTVRTTGCALYDPVAGTWATTTALTQAREHAPAVLLPGGDVLLVGGFSGTAALSSVELHRPQIGSWAAKASMATARFGHTQTLLPDGKILVAGGYNNQLNAILGRCEIYDPATDTWGATGALTTPRYLHSSVLMPNGKVMVMGGRSAAGGVAVYLNSCEIFDPATGSWTGTGAMTDAREQTGVALLKNGKVLITGGTGGPGITRASCELYDPGAGTWSMTGSMLAGRIAHGSALLHNGKVLVAGGVQIGNIFLSSAELYDPAAGTWAATAAMNQARDEASTTLLRDGRVLFAGGMDAATIRSDGEVYDPVAARWTLTGNNMQTSRYEHTAALLPSGNVLVLGGISGGIGPNDQCEIYNPDLNLFLPTAVTPGKRWASTATMLLTGKVFLVGGTDGTGSIVNTQTFDETTSLQAWRSTITTINGSNALPLAVTPGATLDIVGTRFRGGSEGSVGSMMNSSSGIPVVRLQSFPHAFNYVGASENRAWTLSATNWGGGTSFRVTLPSATDMTGGYYLLYAIVNGIAGEAKVLSVGGPPAPPNTNPPAPTSLGQFKSDAVTTIAVGATTNETTVVFKGNVTDSDPGQTVKLQIEVQPIATAFTGNATSESALIAGNAANPQVSITVAGLSNNTSYHWRYRAMDNQGGSSAWASFGNNADGVADFVVQTGAVNNAPALPVSLGQFKSDTVTAIGVGAATNETTVVFKGNVMDSDPGQTVKLQIEVRPIGTAFTNTPTSESALIAGNAANPQVSITVNGLTNNTSYHWQARTMDNIGLSSNWVAFGNNANGVADFQVNTNPNLAPGAPTGLQQFRSDGVLTIPVGGVTPEPQIVIQGTATDPEGGSWKLEVEIRPIVTAFSGTPTHTGTLVASGTASVLTVGGLTNNNYHWRARATDANGASSGWASFGNNADGVTDLTVDLSTNVAPVTVSTSVGQFRMDGVQSIPVGGTTNETSVRHRALIQDNNPGQLLRLKVEVKPVGVAFDGAVSATGNWVTSGTTTDVTAGGLLDGVSYHWRVWSEDTTGASSAFVSFGGNAETDPDFRKGPNSSPSQPLSPEQFQEDGVHTVLVGGTLPSSIVVVRALVSDPDMDPVRLQVEIQPVGTSFTGVPTATSGAFPSGSDAMLSVGGLINLQAYHWQVRSIDSSNNISAWVSFGGNLESQADFRVETAVAGFFSSQPYGSRGSKFCSAGASEQEGGAFGWSLLLVLSVAVLRRRSR